MRDLTKHLNAFREAAIRAGIIVAYQAEGIEFRPLSDEEISRLIDAYCSCGQCRVLGELCCLAINAEKISHLQTVALVDLFEATMTASHREALAEERMN